MKFSDSIRGRAEVKEALKAFCDTELAYAHEQLETGSPDTVIEAQARCRIMREMLRQIQRVENEEHGRRANHTTSTT